MGMLLTESEKAKKVRSLILDFVITTINEKTGGGTKYILSLIHIFVIVLITGTIPIA